MNSNQFERLHNRLKEKVEDVRARPVIYVAFGDSVTQGCMEYGIIEHEQVYHNLFKRQIEQIYPATELSVINSGVSGDTAQQSRPRWQRDLLSFQPDLVTIGFGLNDAHAGPDGLTLFIDTLAELIDTIRSQTPADILLLTPNMMMVRDNSNIHENDRPHIPAFLKTAEAGYLALYRQTLLSLADRMQIACLDQYALWEQMGQQGVDIHVRLANGINHPDRNYHQELADRMIAMIGSDTRKG